MQKLWFQCAVLWTISCFLICKSTVHAGYLENSLEEDEQEDFLNSYIRPIRRERRNPDLKYILVWNSTSVSRNDWGIDYKNIKNGQQIFINKNCFHKNCYITNDIKVRGHYLRFDVILFFANAKSLWTALPHKRKRSQKFVFVSTQPTAARFQRNHHTHTGVLDGFFNWTWTYKLDSDLALVPFVIKDINGNIVGPKPNIKWRKRRFMYPVSNTIEEQFHSKTKAAVMFLSECQHPSQAYIDVLGKILRKDYNLSLDIYGACSDLECSPLNEKNCNKVIKKDYYFYLAFEKYCAIDYVTNILLRAMNYNVLPIVRGCADYKRFLPGKSYLDASKMSPTSLARKMASLIKKFEYYMEYFKWTNHYSYHRTTESRDTDIFCQMCAMINNQTKMQKISTYDNFTSWWNERPSKTLKTPNNIMYDDTSRTNLFQKTWQSIIQSEFWNYLYIFY